MARSCQRALTRTASLRAPTGKLTCHVLDTARGKPAAGMWISLHRLDEATQAWQPIGEFVTNSDGRLDGPALLGVSAVASVTVPYTVCTRTVHSHRALAPYTCTLHVSRSRSTLHYLHALLSTRPILLTPYCSFLIATRRLHLALVSTSGALTLGNISPPLLAPPRPGHRFSPRSPPSLCPCGLSDPLHQLINILPPVPHLFTPELHKSTPHSIPSHRTPTHPTCRYRSDSGLITPRPTTTFRCSAAHGHIPHTVDLERSRDGHIPHTADLQRCRDVDLCSTVL